MRRGQQQRRSTLQRTGWGQRPRIAIVTPNHLVSNPRVIKEADALADVGFDVHVIFAQRAAGTARVQDAALMEHRSWKHTPVRAARTSEPVTWGVGAARQRLFGYVPRRFWLATLAAERASGRVFPLLAAAATQIEADLYIGHYPEGLAAAAVAASANEGLLGFDSEDFHTGEPNPPLELKRTEFLQRRYLPRCKWVTAASAGIAHALAEEYEIEEPEPIFNVFPWADRCALDGLRRDRLADHMSLYWYSQAIGLDRGIQDAIRAVGRLGGPVEIHLRGSVERSVREKLMQIARECGIAQQVFFHAPVPPSQLLSRAAEHDVGLALEQPTSLNRAICTTNKLFFYLLAGLAIAATDVPGQTSVLAECPGAASVYRPGDVDALAATLERWRSDPSSLARAKSMALASAKHRWNWECERQKLINLAQELLLDGQRRATLSNAEEDVHA